MKLSKILPGGLRALSRELQRDEWADCRYLILVDEHTFEYCLPRLVSTVEALQKAQFVELPVGEECKSLEIAAQVWQTLLDEEADRQTVLVNLGGGALCDLGGFVAAGYKRGIRYINVPTTLLSMVDASIGGKTAVDLGEVKNSVGFFHPSALTVIEPAFLESLPREELANGWMEMVKTAAVTDPELYKRLLAASRHSLTPKKQDIVDVAMLKSHVAKADPYDEGVRRILNFGHTFGHTIELQCHLPHGLSVGIGMRLALYLSVKKLGLPEKVYNSYSQWLAAFTAMPSTGTDGLDAMVALMRQDKKNLSQGISCVLLQEVGAPVINIRISEAEARDALLLLQQH